MSVLQTTQLDLHRHFHNLGAGAIEEVRVQRDKGFGFVRYSTHAEAALAIQLGNSHNLLLGKQIKVRHSVTYMFVFSFLSLLFFLVLVVRMVLLSMLVLSMVVVFLTLVPNLHLLDL